MFKGVIAFIGLGTLRFKPPAESPQYPVERRAKSNRNMCDARERSGVLPSHCCCTSAMQIYNSVVIKNKLLSQTLLTFGYHVLNLDSGGDAERATPLGKSRKGYSCFFTLA